MIYACYQLKTPKKYSILIWFSGNLDFNISLFEREFQYMRGDTHRRSQAPKKKKHNTTDSIEYPDIVPFSSFSAISIECPPQDFDLRCPPQFIPKRIPNPPTERDQATLPLPKKFKIKKKIENQNKKDIMYQFSSKVLPSSKNIISDFDVVHPISTQALVSTDGVRQIIQYRQPKIIDLLTPQIKPTFIKPDRHDDISLPQTFVSLSFNEKPMNVEKYVNYLFKSVIAPSHHIEDFDVGLAKPQLRNQKGPQLPLPTLPSITNISVLNSSIAYFEKLNLDPSHTNVYNDNFDASFFMPKKDNLPKYITNPSQLSLLEGEYVVIECIERNPIIRPLIGMSAQLNVIIDARQNIDFNNPERQHPYDKRIPVTQITSTSIQPFVAPIPKDTFVLEMSSSVSTSAISPHKSRSTDFILAPSPESQDGQNITLYLLPMPEQTYLSTSPESTVIIPRPKVRNIGQLLNHFQESPLPSSEELCKARSIIEGILELDAKGIERRAPPSITLSNMEKLSTLPPRIRALVGQYLRNLRATPWIRSSVIARARLGLTKSLAEIINADNQKNDKFVKNHKNDKNQLNSNENKKSSNERKKMQMESKEKLRSELAASFENNLMFIQSSTENENDMMMDLTFMDEDDEENWNEVLDDIELDDVKGMENDPATSKTKINWEALGLGNLPMRKVMKVIDYQLADGQVSSSISWVRDKKEIHEEQVRIRRSRNRRSRASNSEKGDD